MRASNPWWEIEDPEGRAHAMYARVKHIETEQSTRYTENCIYATRYSGRRELFGFDIDSERVSRISDVARVEECIGKTIIDVAASLIAKHKPRIRVQTMNGKWEDRAKAKRLEKFCLGEFRSKHIYELVPQVFTDSCIWGTGCIKVIEDDISFERVLIDEIIADEKACRYGMRFLQDIYQRRLVDVNALIEQFPEEEEEILRYAGSCDWVDGMRIPEGQVVVVEGWRKGGKHCIAIGGYELFCEDWPHDFFPLLFLHWTQPLTGFYGDGVIHEVEDLQREYDSYCTLIGATHKLFGTPTVFWPIGDIPKIEWSNEIGNFIPYSGNRPDVYTPQMLSSEIYSERNAIYEKAFRRIGISEASAQGARPVGVEAAAAIREVSERETSRFALVSQRVEQFYLEVAEMLIRVAAMKYKNGQKVKTKWASKNVVEEIDWKDVDLDRDRYMMSVEAASILTLTPAARMQQVTELAQVGALSQQEIRYLLDHPDMERSNSLANANFEDIEIVLDRLSEGKDESPEPFQDLQLGLQRVQQGLMAAKRDGAPAKIQQGYRNWISAAKAILAKGQGAANEQPPVPGELAQPPGTGGALPQQEAPLGSGLDGAPGPLDAMGAPLL